MLCGYWCQLVCGVVSPVYLCRLELLACSYLPHVIARGSCPRKTIKDRLATTFVILFLYCVPLQLVSSLLASQLPETMENLSPCQGPSLRQGEDEPNDGEMINAFKVSMLSAFPDCSV